jgi:hypothetical protein
LTAKGELKRVTTGPGLPEVVKNTQSKGVKVGVLRGQGAHPNAKQGQTIVEIAFWNEYGTSRIPARSFLRSTMKDQKDVYKRIIAALLKQVLNLQRTSAKAISELGTKAQADIQQKITVISIPPNSPKTIELKKGKANPLIDSGTLRRSISWELI